MIKKICNIVSITLLTIMIFMVLALAGPPLLGYKTYAVLSGSMEPKLQVGSMAYVKPTRPNAISKGDIITYTLSGDSKTLVTHRVIDIDYKNKEFITKGDANEVKDGPIGFQRLVGKMIFTIPYLGYAAVYLKTKKGLIIIAAILVLMILSNTIPEILKKEEQKI